MLTFSFVYTHADPPLATDVNNQHRQVQSLARMLASYVKGKEQQEGGRPQRMLQVCACFCGWRGWCDMSCRGMGWCDVEL